MILNNNSSCGKSKEIGTEGFFHYDQQRFLLGLDLLKCKPLLPSIPKHRLGEGISTLRTPLVFHKNMENLSAVEKTKDI